MPGFILFVIGLAGALILFTVPGINVWFGWGFWAALASIIGVVAGIGLMAGALMRPISDR